jgi:hypothetical protein
MTESTTNSKVFQNRKKEANSFSVQGDEFLRVCKENGKVFIFKQNELLEADPFALCFEDTDFWVGTFQTQELAKEKAQWLGLTLV